MNKVRNIRYIKLFGERLKSVRLEKGFSQENLAYASDIPISQIGRIERGEINTTISTIYSISVALEIDVCQLFDFKI